LYDYLMDHTDLVSWCDMEEALDEIDIENV